jgi:hypothetical protein
MSIGLAFSQALNGPFGPAQNFTATAGGAQQNLIYGGGPALLYGFTILASAAGGIDIQIVDASATATGSTPTWRTLEIPQGGINEDFMRPIPFSKGIVFSCTVTGNPPGTINFNAQWSPLPTTKYL